MTAVRELGTIQLTSSLALALHHLQESLLRLLALSVMLSYLLCQGASPALIYICTGRRLLRQPQRRSRAARRVSGRGSERSPRLTTAPCLPAPLGGSGASWTKLDCPQLAPISMKGRLQQDTQQTLAEAEDSLCLKPPERGRQGDSIPLNTWIHLASRTRSMNFPKQQLSPAARQGWGLPGGWVISWCEPSPSFQSLTVTALDFTDQENRTFFLS